jgi:hypothetical protein
MRSASPTPARSGRPIELRVRLHAAPTRVEVDRSDARTPSHHAAPAAVVPPPAPPAPPPPAKTAPVTPPPAPEAPNVDFRETDAGRELLADRERINAVLEQVRAAVKEFADNQFLRLQQWQRAAVELASTIAARLLHERVTAEEFPMEAKVRDMVAQFGEGTPVTVRLNPADLRLLEKRLHGEPLFPDGNGPALVADESLGRAAVQVEGKESMLLSEVTRELQEIRDELLRSLSNARS